MNKLLITIRDFFRLGIKHIRIPMDKKRKTSHLKLSDIPKGLDAFAESLTNVCKGVEGDFLEIGRNLQAIHSEAEELTTETMNAIHAISGDESILTRVIALARESETELKNRQIRVKTNMDYVTEIVRHLSGLDTMCAEMERIALYLGIIGLNMNIESSRSEQAKEMFFVVADEIRRLSGRVLETSGAIRDHSESARNVQIIAFKDISDDLKSLDKLSDHAGIAVQNAVKGIEQFSDISKTILDQACSYSQRIAAHFGEIVVGIQLHDSMNQRIEHIVKALMDVKGELESNSGALKSKKNGITTTLLASLDLQAEQLNHIISDIYGVYDTSVSAFKDVNDDAQKLARCLSGFKNDNPKRDDTEKNHEDSLTILKDAIAHLQNLLNQARNLIDKIQKTTNQASQTSTELSNLIRQVQNFSFETHLIALNAIVKAAHIGETGKTLEVLSHEMKNISHQAREFVSDVEKILEAVMALSENLQQCQMSSEQGTSTPVVMTRRKLDTGIQTISNAYSQFTSDAFDVSMKAEEMEIQISDIRSRLDFLPALAREFNGCLEQLFEIKHHLDKSCGNIQYADAKLEHLETRYSMRKERDVHQIVMNRYDSSLQPAAKIGKLSEKKPEIIDKAKSSDEDDLGDNVELF